MMPVSGECSAPMQASSGSSARAALPPISSSPSTPLKPPCTAIAWILSSSAALVATTSLPHRKCGKLVVATNAAELDKIQAIAVQGGFNGVEGLELIGGNAARALEPELACIGALHSPETGIIDGHAYMLALRGDLEDAGGAIAFNTPVTGAKRKDWQWWVRFGGADAGEFAFDAG